ncbi:leucine carboxyl methyltransferase 1 isoform X2 [Bacillus rossius redtenbacheri]|uniref:leucine carboxyl methyltransferase 1 isoform X2 n=1 Tax=Bacillus rossius redtenbacheri TaxID=93214 RepID=UPI002FDEE731
MAAILQEEAIQATNDDATSCKLAAVSLGYWEDPYVSYFIRSPTRKPPEINRGYYARVKGVESLINKFIKKVGNNCQIINLGAGFDTLFWRLQDTGHSVANFIELDFPAVTSKKCICIQKNKNLFNRLKAGDAAAGCTGADLHGTGYHLLGVDLQSVDRLLEKLDQCGVQDGLPTLLLAECVLVYMRGEEVHRLLSCLARRFRAALFVSYEQVNMNDRFGDMMLTNLRARSCHLPSVAACRDLDSQRQRFLQAGWDGAKAWDMVEVYHSLTSSERRRIERLEFLDEQELLMQLLQHYCIAVAWKSDLFADVSIAD